MGKKNKLPKLRDLKKLLDSLTEAQLDQYLLYNSEEYSVSGKARLSRQKHDLYYNGEDDPATLMTKTEIIKDYGKDYLKGCVIEIPKGSIVIEFGC